MYVGWCLKGCNSSPLVIETCKKENIIFLLKCILMLSLCTFQFNRIVSGLDWTKSTIPYKSIHHQHSDLHTSNSSSLHVLAKTQNKPKLVDSSQNDKKLPKNWKLGKSGIFYRLFFSKLRAQMPKFEYFRLISVNFLIIKIYQKVLISNLTLVFSKLHFARKSINFLISAKFRMYPIPNVLISNLTLIFEGFESKSLNMDILG